METLCVTPILYGLFLGIRAVKRPSKIPHVENSSFDNTSTLSIDHIESTLQRAHGRSCPEVNGPLDCSEQPPSYFLIFYV
jgi:hypothetical protein